MENNNKNVVVFHFCLFSIEDSGSTVENKKALIKIYTASLMQVGHIGEKRTSKYDGNSFTATLLKTRRFKTIICKNGNNEIKMLFLLTYRCKYRSHDEIGVFAL